MRTVAFFDLDLTLLTVNSGMLWIRAERRAGRLRLRQYLEGVFYMVAYRLHLMDIERAIGRALKTVAGLAEDELRARTQRWYDREVVHCVAPGARWAIEAHRRAGHRLVLLTSSSPYAAELAAAQFNLDGWLSSHYEVRDGRLTGRPLMPLCFGRGKVTLAQQFAQHVGADLSQSFFYTDSASDQPMLEHVGYPRIVNPDWRLRRVARKRGWPIVDWGHTP